MVPNNAEGKTTSWI